MKVFHLGKKNEDGDIAQAAEFEVTEHCVLFTLVPGREMQRLTIEDAREKWQSLLSDGFARIDKRLAIAFSARIASREAELREDISTRRSRLLYGNRTRDEEDYRF
jgi:hypothetical protein